MAWMERGFWFITGTLLGGLAWTALAMSAHREPPPAEDRTRIVRMVELTIHGLRDTNSSGRSQKFNCEVKR